MVWRRAAPWDETEGELQGTNGERASWQCVRMRRGGGIGERRINGGWFVPRSQTASGGRLRTPYCARPDGTPTFLSCGNSAFDRRLEGRSRMRRESHVRFCEGGGVRFPSATRLVVGFQHKWDAEQYLRDLWERLTRFGLSLHPDKTRLVEFGRFAAVKRRQRGAGKPETFDFPGFHASLHDDPARTLQAWSQTGRQTGQQDLGAHRRGAPQALAPRHPGGGRMARAGLPRLAELLRRSGVEPVPS